MRNLGLLAIPICLTLSIAQAQTPPSSTSLRRIGLEKMWASQARVNPSRDKVSHLTFDERHVYVQSSNGSLTAFDAENGTRKWTVQVGPPGRTPFPASTNGSVVVVVAAAKIYGINKFTGHILWAVKTPGSAATAAAVDEKEFYVGTTDGSVYAFSFAVVEYYGRNGRLPGSFNPETREITSPIGPTPSTHTWMWRYRTGRPIEHTPTLSSLMVLFGDKLGQVYGISKGTRQEQGGKLRFQYQSGHGIVGRIIAEGNNVFVPTTENRLVAANVPTGSALWNFAAGNQILGDPKYIADRLYFVSEGEGLFALNTADGSHVPTPTGKWWVPGATKFLGITPSLVLASGAQNNVVAVDRKTAQPRGQLRMDDFTIRATNDLNDRIYMISEQGLVLCLREPGSETPVFYRNLDQAPITPELSEEKPADNTARSDN